MFEKFVRLRQNTPYLAAGMNGKANYGAIRLDTPPLAVGSFIGLSEASFR
jgi:hypothetical protein